VTAPVGAALPLLLHEPVDDTPAIMPTTWFIPTSLQCPTVGLTSADPGSEQSVCVYDVTLVSAHETPVGGPQLQLPIPQRRSSTTFA
jgi:hypothetical protein